MEEENKKEEQNYVPEEKKIKEKRDTKIIWMVSTIVIAVLLIVSIFTHGNFGIRSVTGAAIGGGDIEKKVKDYIEDYLVRAGTEVNVKKIGEENGLYKLEMGIGLQKFDAYVTKDGELLFPSVINLDEKPELLEDVEEEIPKRDKPKVELFVMSQCPFGVSAFDAFSEVLKLFGNKIDFNLYFIANENKGVFESLHGQTEVNEDLRQLCAVKYYPQKYIDYILCVNKDYRNVDSIWEDCAKKSGLDVNKIKDCSEGEEGKKLLRGSIKVSEEKKVSGSPTMFINDVRYSGSRTSDGYKQGVCSGFRDEPKECEKKLSGTATTTSGSC